MMEELLVVVSAEDLRISMTLLPSYRIGTALHSLLLLYGTTPIKKGIAFPCLKASSCLYIYAMEGSHSPSTENNLLFNSLH